MIDSREQYRLVEIPPDMVIDGQILPLRTGTEQRVLRGEDVCFLMEHRNRARLAFTDDFNIFDSMDFVLRGSRLQALVDWMQRWTERDDTLGGIPVESDISFARVYAWDEDQTPTDIPVRLAPGRRLDLGDIASSPASFMSGQAVALQPLVTLFNDFDKFRTFQGRFNQGMNWYTHSGYTEIRVDPEHVITRRTNLPNVYRYRAQSYAAGQWAELRETSSNPHVNFTVRQYKATYLGDDAVVMLRLDLEKSWKTEEERGYKTIKKYYCYPLMVRQTNGDGIFRANGADISNIIAEIKHENGLDDQTDLKPGEYSEDGSKGVYSAYISTQTPLYGIFRTGDDTNWHALGA